MPMIGSFYAPSEWAQPNQRNIGDSLLDLYKMKRQIEQDRMAAEEARMALETKKLAMQESLERAKQEREGQKAFAELMKGQQVQKPAITPGSVIGGLTKGAGMLGDLYQNAGQLPSVLTRAMQGSFPQMPSLSTTQTVQEPVNFKDPAIQARLVQILASMPSKQGVLDDALRAAMAPESRALTFEQQMEKEQFRANLKLGIEATRYKLARDLQDNKFTQQGKLDAQKRLEAFNYASQLLAQNIDGRVVVAHLNSILNAPVVDGEVDGVPMKGVRRVNPETGAPEFIPLQPVGASSAPMPSPASAPAPVPTMAPATAPVPPAAPAAGPNAPSMDLSGADLTPRGGGVETLYSEGTEPTASFTPDVAPPPAPGQIVQPIKRESTLDAQKTRTLREIQRNYNTSVRGIDSLGPNYATMMRHLQGVIEDWRNGAPRSATRSEMIRILRAKALDPTSVVREGEVFRYEILQGVSERLRNFLMTLEDNKEFTPQQALNVMKEMRVLYDKNLEWKALKTAATQKEMAQAGIDPTKLVEMENMDIMGRGTTTPKIPAGGVLAYGPDGKPVGYMLNGAPYNLDGTPYKEEK